MIESNNYKIIIVGDSFQLYMAAHYLSDELNNRNVSIIPIEIRPEITHVMRHAFTPFAGPFLPALKGLESKAKIAETSIQNVFYPMGFSFNFADYGTTSSSITFLQAYEIATKNNPKTPNFDQFLNIENKDFGVLYSTQELSEFFQRNCARKNIYTIPTDSINVNINNNYIESVTTDGGQTLSADLYLDCSRGQHLINKCQTAAEINTDEIPRFDRAIKEIDSTSSAQNTCAIKEIPCGIIYSNRLALKIFEQTFNFNDFDGGILQISSYFENPWSSNCVALGNGYCDIPELLICRDRIIETQLLTLSRLLPLCAKSENAKFAKKHYATISQRLLDEAIDSINLLLVSGNRNLKLTTRNERRKKLFESSATTHKEDHSMISENCWGALLTAAGYKPQDVNAIASTRKGADIEVKINSLIAGEVK